MDSSSIQLSGSQIDAISFEEARLRVRFSRAIIIKTMTGSVERTRWWQSGDLVLEQAELQSQAPPGPLTCAGGDIDDNLYTYRDMIPLPLESRGRIGCRLAFRDSEEELIATGEALRMEMQGVPKYIEHMRPETTP